MQAFSIKDVESLCGIKAHTLRIWEHRYGLGSTGRKAVKHLPRVYTNDDLKKMLLVAQLYDRGHKISYLAGLQHNGLKELLNKEIEETGELSFIHHMLEAALSIDAKSFEQLLHRAFSEKGFEAALKQVVYPYLIRVGNLWLQDKTIPAQEHFASNIIRNKIILSIDNLPGKTYHGDAPCTLLFAPANEYHEIPLLIAEYFLRSRHIHLVNVGCNTSVDVLKQLISHKKIAAIYFHPITNFTGHSCQEYIENLSLQFKDCTIIMAGPLTRFVEAVSENIKLLKSEDEMFAFLKSSHFI